LNPPTDDGYEVKAGANAKKLLAEGANVLPDLCTARRRMPQRLVGKTRKCTLTKIHLPPPMICAICHITIVFTCGQTRRSRSSGTALLIKPASSVLAERRVIGRVSAAAINKAITELKLFVCGYQPSSPSASS
jgi:hypothetical protein